MNSRALLAGGVLLALLAAALTGSAAARTSRDDASDGVARIDLADLQRQALGRPAVRR